jgi:radical SAM superfamily enzyme YgiQ (UPF0313 family)
MNVLLVGPYDPLKGAYSFVSPPLGVWRICGFLRHYGITCHAFDPNLSADPYTDLEIRLISLKPPLVGFSLTGLTLPYDLSLVHWAKKKWPALCIGGGVEAAFNFDNIFQNAPLDYCVVGEGELPMLNICDSLMRLGHVPERIPGVVYPKTDGNVMVPNSPLPYTLFKFSSFAMPYDEMPYPAYWDKLLELDGSGPSQVSDSDRLTEAMSIRVMTSNYCPKKCNFCSYTNFLPFSCNMRRVKVTRLTPGDISRLLVNILRYYPQARTIIFQDDLFTLREDSRILPLCRELIEAKAGGALPSDLSFIATTRIDTMRPEYLAAMRRAGFRLIGYGVGSFSEKILREYGKELIFSRLDEVLEATLRSGIKVFLDIILTSPESTLPDVALTLNKCVSYLRKGCEISIYPTIIPFAGSEIMHRPSLKGLITYENVRIPRTDKIIPVGRSIEPADPELRSFLLRVEKSFNSLISDFRESFALRRFTSRFRGLLYILAVLEASPGMLDCSKREIISLLMKEARQAERPEATLIRRTEQIAF